MRIALAAMLMTATASAAPRLAPLWRAGNNCPQLYSESSDALLALDDKHTSLTRIDRATGKELGKVAVKLPRKDARIVKTVGQTVVLETPGEFVALDATTGKPLWKRAIGKKQPWQAHAVAFGEDVVLSWADHPGKRGAKTIVERIDPATGASKWKVEEPFGSDFWLGAGTTHLFIADVTKASSAVSILALALDPETGKELWRALAENRTASYGTPVVAGDGIAIAMGTDEIQLVGPGGGLVALAMPVHQIEGAAGRAFVLRDRDLVAFDVATGKQLWVVPQTSDEALIEYATASMVYVHDNRELMRVIDAATGKQLETYGVGDTPFIFEHAGVPAITYCDGKALVALDPSAPAQADETVTVTGTLVCPECGDPHLDVRVGDAFGKTDEHGKFTLTAKGRGKLALTWLVGNIWQRVEVIDPSHHAYDVGKQVVHPDEGGG